MNIKVIYTLLLLLPVISACQKEEAQLPNAPKRLFTVRASLPGNDVTRSHITYGNQDTYLELFRWHEISEQYSTKDYITVFNVSRLSECPNGIQLETTYVSKREAIFESLSNDDNSNFQVKAGDLLFVNYWETGRETTNDGSDIFTILVGSEGNKPQIIVENPNDASMSYMQGNLKMYDIVTAVEDGKIPDIYFRHLSAIMHVTLRNETGADFYPKELQFVYPGTESFFINTLYCSVDLTASNGSGLKIYDNGEFNEGGYTNTISSAINNYTAADTEKGTFIALGQSYDLYLSCVPRIANTQTGEQLIIRLQKRIGSSEDKWYEITLNDFNTPIEAGKRYWFNLTAVEGDREDDKGKLVLTNEWLDAHNL